MAHCGLLRLACVGRSYVKSRCAGSVASSAVANGAVRRHRCFNGFSCGAVDSPIGTSQWPIYSPAVATTDCQLWQRAAYSLGLRVSPSCALPLWNAAAVLCGARGFRANVRRMPWYSVRQLQCLQHRRLDIVELWQEILGDLVHSCTAPHAFASAHPIPSPPIRSDPIRAHARAPSISACNHTVCTHTHVGVAWQSML